MTHLANRPALLACTLAAALLGGCGNTDSEFIARDTDLQDPSAWPQTVPPRFGPGPDAALLGMAHDAMDLTITRSIYINKLVSRGSAGQFPLGTILLKLSRREGKITGGTAMVKRGGQFNPEAGDWEWFVLRAEGGVMLRGGAEVMDGACNRCHAARKDQDFVFTR